MKQFFKAIWGMVLIATLMLGCKSDDDSTVTPTSASVSALTCASVAYSTSAVNGTAYTGTATVPYTGGNGVAYAAGSAISSSGVTGLSATLQAGTLASGAGNLTYAVSGTPSGPGTATFVISFGGQTCSLALTVSASTGTTTANSSDITTALSVTTSTTSCTSTGIAQIACLSEAFKATLTSAQLTTAQLTYTKANAQKWSNLPAALSSRIGINLTSLSTTQLAAFRNLIVALLALGTDNEGYDEMIGNLVADEAFGFSVFLCKSIICH